MLIVLDTETVGLTDRAVYDVSYLVCSGDAKRVICERAFLVSEVFTDSKRMRGAFYADRVFSEYPAMLADGIYTLASFQRVREVLARDLAEHKISALWAYNSPFDMRALRDTCQAILGHRRLFVGSVPPVLDIWANACNTVCRSKHYRAWARLSGHVSARGNVGTGADVVYRYVTGRDNYAHPHIGILDCDAERTILAAILSRKRKLVRHYVAAPWVWAQ